jgi:hypothetical protein
MVEPEVFTLTIKLPSSTLLFPPDIVPALLSTTVGIPDIDPVGEANRKAVPFESTLAYNVTVT